jgi:hypothetical protein
MLSISTGSTARFAGKSRPDKRAMRFSIRSTARRSSALTAKPRAAAAIAVCLVLGLGACSPFSSYVADNWPHWAGGEPTGLPPRRGSPGYDAYIAHGQPVQNPQTPVVAPQASPAVETTQAANQTSAPVAQRTNIFGGPQVAASRPSVSPTAQASSPPSGQSAPVSDSVDDDGSVVRGGLY